MNARIYRVERWFTGVSLVLMGAMVLLDVLHRFWTRQEGLFAQSLYVSRAIGGVLGVLLVYAALRMRGRASWLRAIVSVAVAYGAMELFVWLVPYGLVWSQTLGLMLMLWVACAGASMATYEHRHLALDLGSKLWPKKALPYAQALGNLITALFCGLLGALALYSIKQHLGDWQETDHAGGTFAAIAFPKWIAFMAMPVSFFIMAARFFAQTIDSFKGKVEEDDALQMLGLKK